MQNQNVKVVSRGRPQYESKRKGYYWNEHIMPETNAIDKFKFDNKKAEGLRKAGFGVVNTHLQDGIIRGTSVLSSAEFARKYEHIDYYLIEICTTFIV